MPKLTFLGTSGSVLTKERMCAGILFDDKLLDVGFGVLANLIRLGKKLDSISDLYISHTHSDHIGDFTGLVWAMAMKGRTRPLRVVSSSSAGAALERILDLQSTPYAWVKFEITFVRPEDVSVKSVTTVHDPENLAYRFQTDRGDLVYIGDTAKSEKISEFAKGMRLADSRLYLPRWTRIAGSSNPTLYRARRGKHGKACQVEKARSDTFLPRERGC